MKQKTGNQGQGGNKPGTGKRIVHALASLAAAVCLCAAVLWLNPAPGAGRDPCPPQMAYLPPGSYPLGTAPDKAGYLLKICKDAIGNCSEHWFEPEMHYYAQARLSATCIDRFEYPNEPGVRPATGMDLAAADRTCRAQGKVLCSDVEWEAACTGGSRRAWPYGGAYQKDACNDAGREIEPSGARAACVSPAGGGVYDMAGNAAEWTRSTLDHPYPENSASGAPRVVKGGSYMDHPLFTRCAFRETYDPEVKYDTFGFRCCGYPR